MKTVADVRIEKDSLGEVEVPGDAYFGPQTIRAIQNFQISGTRIGEFETLIVAFGLVKKAAARANSGLGIIDSAIAGYIDLACDELISGAHLGEFPIDVFQGGAGTSINMNANEVIANIALAHAGAARGDYARIHPNNHVNLSQSTNDVYPTAVRLAILLSYPGLHRALETLAEAFDERGHAFGSVLKLGRTQLQDAVPMTLGQEFEAFATMLRDECVRLTKAAAVLYEINLGGTAIGTGINAPPEYRQRVVTELAALTGLPFVSASDLIGACWDTSAFVQFSGTMKCIATKLSKICNDLRLLSSGPRGGFNEINLPSLQPGSSIMPGKVNPVIPEVVNQAAFQIIGNDLTITLAAEAGQLQLNVMEPIICYNILNGLNLLQNAAEALRTRCVSGISANVDECLRHLEAGSAVVTALTPFIGYEKAADLAKQVLGTGKSVRQLLEEDPQLAQELAPRIINPFELAGVNQMTATKRIEDHAASLSLPPQ